MKSLSSVAAADSLHPAAQQDHMYSSYMLYASQHRLTRRTLVQSHADLLTYLLTDLG